MAPMPTTAMRPLIFLAEESPPMLTTFHSFLTDIWGSHRRGAAASNLATRYAHADQASDPILTAVAGIRHWSYREYLMFVGFAFALQVIVLIVVYFLMVMLRRTKPRATSYRLTYGQS